MNASSDYYTFPEPHSDEVKGSENENTSNIPSIEKKESLTSNQKTLLIGLGIGLIIIGIIVAASVFGIIIPAVVVELTTALVIAYIIYVLNKE